MVSSMTRKMISLAISLLVVVISLTGVAVAAIAPTVSPSPARYVPGFSGAPGKIAQDEAGNLYVADFWGKGIMKLDRNGGKSGFIPTEGRPTAVAVMSDYRLVVATQAPPSVAFYSQSGVAPNVTGAKISDFGTPANPLYRPVAITKDAAGYIYVLDAGDLINTNSQYVTTHIPRVRVYSSTGSYLYAFGERMSSGTSPASYPADDTKFKQPLAIAYEKNLNQIIVADSMNGRLQFYKAYSNDPAMPFVKTVGQRATQITAPSNGAWARLSGPHDIALEYTAAGVFHRIYVTEKSTDEVAVIDAAPFTPSTCDSASNMCDNRQLMRISAATVTNGGVTHPTGVFFEKTVTGGGVLYVSNALSSTNDANVAAFVIDNGNSGTTVDLQIDPVAETVTSSTLAVSGTVSPVYDVYCSLNDGSYSIATRSGGTWNITFVSTLVSGSNWITCKSSDGSKTTYKQVSTFYTSDPETIALSITNPAEGSTSYTTNSTVMLSGTSTGATIAIPGSTCAPVDANGNWSCSVSIAPGINTINVTAAKQGAANVTKTVTVVKDTTAPGVVISALSEDAVTNNAIQNFDGIVSDANPVAAIEVNGVVVPAYARKTVGTDTYFSAPVTLVRGENALIVKATDEAGNLTIITRTIVLDPEEPGLTVDIPADNSYMTGVSSAPGSGLVDASFTSVDACGSVVTPSSGTWATVTDFALDAGLNTCEFTASGGVTPIVKVKRTILNDAAYAKLAITSPAADIATKDSSILVAGYVAPGSADLTVSIDGGNGATVTPDAGGYFSATVDLGSEGIHVVKVTTANGTSAVRNIIYDNTAPGLGIQSDSRSMPPVISGAIEGSARISAINASLDSIPVTIPLSVLTFGPYNSATDSVVWHANLSAYAYDTISFTTTDPAGNDKVRVRTAAIPKGDIDKDGYVKLSDALAVLRHAAGTGTLTGDDFIEGDVGSLVDGRVSSDGDVNVIDAVLILQKAYGLVNF